MTYKFTRKTVTIGDLILNWLPVTNVNPVGQRLDVNPKLEGGKDNPSKAQGIIGTLLEGINIGEITLVENPPLAKVPHTNAGGEGLYDDDNSSTQYQYESIDGGHRKRYIKSFFDNHFPLHGTKKYFKDFSKAERESFLDIELSLCIYEPLPNKIKGYIFRTINKTTDVNHQEHMNSYGDTPIANAIRETTRLVPGVNNRTHPLFETSGTNKQGEKIFTWLAFNNKRLKMDEAVARLYYIFYNGGPLGTASDKDLEKMYSDETLEKEDVNKLAAKVDALLSFLENMAYIRKQTTSSNKNKGLAWKEFVILSRLYFYMKDTYNDFKIKDNEKFYKEFRKVLSNLTAKYPQGKYKQLVDLPFDKQGRTRKEAFCGYCGDHDNYQKIKQTVLWMIEDFDIHSHLVVKDSKRNFDPAWKEQKLIDQDYKDAVDGKPINLDNSVMAHIVAHADGGKTEYANLALTTEEHNRRMGQMNLYSYKELYESQNDKKSLTG